MMHNETTKKAENIMNIQETAWIQSGFYMEIWT